MPYNLLAGIRVVEASMYAFAPSAGAVLADWGADVIKVVPPETMDPMNGNPVAGLPDREVGVAFMWEITNRGKRCVGVDQRTEGGQRVMASLVGSADVFITNLLPSARRRFRVDVDDLTAIRPGLIYARASGHGPRGPESDAGGFDHTDFWARTGMAQAASQVSDEFVPQPGPALGDLASGAFLAGGIAAALFRRERTGEGAVVDVSLQSSGMWMFSPGVVASQLYDIDAIPPTGISTCRTPSSLPTGPATTGSSTCRESRPRSTPPSFSGPSDGRTSSRTRGSRRPRPGLATRRPASPRSTRSSPHATSPPGPSCFGA
jgi:crotonobetainyl-CoA:carnitine CoA-transferase CaiB-like acyl-CoA transferase